MHPNFLLSVYGTQAGAVTTEWEVQLDPLRYHAFVAVKLFASRQPDRLPLAKGEEE
jgi:hypothetical protein